jgi:hypothetical protein
MREPCPTCGCMHCAHQRELPLEPLKPAANLFEFRDIQKFAAACRKQWPGAVITLRSNSEFVREHDAEPIGFVVGAPDAHERIANGSGFDPTNDDECCSD